MNHLFTGCDLPCTPLHVAPSPHPPPPHHHACCVTHPDKDPQFVVKMNHLFTRCDLPLTPPPCTPPPCTPLPRHACCLTHPDEETKFVIEMNHLFTRCDLFGFGGTHEPVDVPAEKRGKYTIKALPVHPWFNVKLKLLLNIPIDLLMDFI